MVVDHGRIVIDIDVSWPHGKTERVRAWIDNGNPSLEMSRRLADPMGTIVCNGQMCSTAPPQQIAIGGRSIPISLQGPRAIKEARVPSQGSIAPGLPVDINIPSTILRDYDVLIDFPGRQLTIARPGLIQFRGPSAKVLVNSENGLIQIPSQIENKKYNLALDLGASISFLSQERFEKLAAAHPDWPGMTGAVGPANMWGEDGELWRKLMRLDRVQYGPLFLTNVAVAEFPKVREDYFVQRAGVGTAGLLGAQALQNYRVGLDYAHSQVHFEIGRTFNFPDFDVVGLVLRPEDDGRFTILGAIDSDTLLQAEGVTVMDHLIAVNDIPVSGSTMGQVWSMLGGTPGQERKLTVERAGKQFVVVAKVQHFLAEHEDDSEGKKQKKK